jgi:diguanylate cyclase (GGDEF)-like protein/PAS domain S-box-containing protein
MKVVTRLVLMFVLISVLPLGLFGYFSLSEYEDTLREQELAGLSSLADKKVSQVKGYLRQRELEVRLRARGPLVIAAMMRLPGLYRAGTRSAGYLREEKVLRESLGRYIEENGLFYDLFLITREGEIIYTQKHEPDFATNLVTGPWRDSELARAFREASMTMEPVISRYEYYTPSQAPSLFMAAPIMVNGKFEGVFAVQLDNALLYRVALDATGLGDTGESLFAQNDGGGVLYTTPLKYSSNAEMKLHIERTGNDVLPIFFALNGNPGEGISKDYRGVPVAAAWRFLPGLDWGMVVKVDTSEVFAPLYRQRNLILGGLGGLLLLSALLAAYFGLQLSLPIRGLLRATAAMAEGDMNVQADERAPGELGHLARVFNRMASNMQSLYHTLEDRVEDRTRSLNAANEKLQLEIRERARFELALRDNREQLRAALKVMEQHKLVLDLVRDGFWIVDMHGKLLEVNQAYAEISGYSMDELLGSYISRYEIIESPEETQAHINKIISEGHDRFETRHRHKDGHIIEIEVSTIYLRESNQLAVFLRDITENKQAQAELRHRQELLNEAERLGHLGSWELNLASGELHWSDEIYRIFELDPLLFKPSYDAFLNAIHPDDRAAVDQAYTLSLLDRAPYDIEHRLRMPDGRTKWVREHCVSIFDESGKPMRSMGAVQDITAQKLAEERLRVAAVAFEMQEAIMVTDAQANILRVNRAFQKITGDSAEEVVGKNPRILSSGRQDKEFYAEMWRQLIQYGSWAGEMWDRRKNGEVYPKWLTISAARDGRGNITEYVAIFNDITARKQAEEEIRNLAYYDALTGLPNRRMLLDRFHQALSLAARSHQCGAILFLDMDRFKTLNDTMGHDYGDLMLVEVGRRMQGCVRESDTVARIGGDEFVVLVEEVGTDLQEALRVVVLIAEKVRASLAQPYLLGSYEFHSSPSIGVSMYAGKDEQVDELMKRADLAMYQAKESGRNTVRFFDPMMQRSVETRAALESDLRSALSSGQLSLYYQVQVDRGGVPVGAEALLRWKHPKRGMVSPAEFIPVAEESGMIIEIGRWVIEQACRQLGEWEQDERLSQLVLAVNVSAQQFGAADFTQRVEEAIVRNRVVSTRLKLELTESVVLQDVLGVIGKMHALKALGVGLSLDDFGTGYSSLAYLKQLPLEQIKIDPSFVRDITSDPNDAVMVRTIIGMAQNFRLQVIAEGVENGEQLEFLRQCGCALYQGYLFGRPVPKEEFEALARSLFESAERQA